MLGLQSAEDGTQGFENASERLDLPSWVCIPTQRAICLALFCIWGWGLACGPGWSGTYDLLTYSLLTS